LSETKDEFIQGHQVVICADILEHTPDPSNELHRLVCLQPSRSVFFISVPNIANIWVRLNLLFGRFNYTDRGILDRTHLRFFTRSTITQMISTAGLEIEKIVPTPIPLHLVHHFFDHAALGRWFYWLLNKMTQAVPTLLGYQFVVYAKKHSS
jgi:2-polyprenyl-3-methyl-5-hydroxy-6-metoxy-1,4-benzoquinol methylase